MNIEELYITYNIDFKTEGHKHTRPNWVNTECPFCSGNFGYHLGYNKIENYYYCWRCGFHSNIDVIKEILKVTGKEAHHIIKEYEGIINTKETIVKIQKNKPFKFPTNCTSLEKRHERYLEKRGFDYLKLCILWDLKGTGVISQLDNIEYKHRILAPIYWGDKVVTFQTRDITNKHPMKYLACPKNREIIHHKHILYGKQEFWKDTGICVEGITDVWRFGVNSFAVLGIEYTSIQLRLIAKKFKRVAIVFDDDKQAIKQANKLISELQFRGVDAFKIDIKGDPGNMKQEDANHLVKDIIK